MPGLKKVLCINPINAPATIIIIAPGSIYFQVTTKPVMATNKRIAEWLSSLLLSNDSPSSNKKIKNTMILNNRIIERKSAALSLFSFVTIQQIYIKFTHKKGRQWQPFLCVQNVLQFYFSLSRQAL